MAETGALHFNI